MTPLELQIALRKEIERITKDVPLLDLEGNPAKLRAYMQELPIRTVQYEPEELKDAEEMDYVANDVMDENGAFPYCIVRIEDGETKNAFSAQYVRVILLFGVCYRDLDTQGHQVIANIFQRIQERFYKNAVLDQTFIMRDEDGNQKMPWAHTDYKDETHPYYFGAMGMTWCLPSIRREDDYS